MATFPIGGLCSNERDDRSTGDMENLTRPPLQKSSHPQRPLCGDSGPGSDIS